MKTSDYLLSSLDWACSKKAYKKNRGLSFYVLFPADDVAHPPLSHAKTWLLVVEEVSFIGPCRETRPPLDAMWRKVQCDTVMGGGQAASPWHGGDLPCYSCLSLTIPRGLKGLLPSSWGGWKSSGLWRLQLQVLPGCKCTCPSMTYLSILPLCQTATFPPNTPLTCQMLLAAPARRSAAQPDGSSHFTPYWVRMQSKHRPYWHCQILLFQGLGCFRGCKDKIISHIPYV